MNVTKVLDAGPLRRRLLGALVAPALVFGLAACDTNRGGVSAEDAAAIRDQIQEVADRLDAVEQRLMDLSAGEQTEPAQLISEVREVRDDVGEAKNLLTEVSQQLADQQAEDELEPGLQDPLAPGGDPLAPPANDPLRRPRTTRWPRRQAAASTLLTSATTRTSSATTSSRASTTSATAPTTPSMASRTRWSRSRTRWYPTRPTSDLKAFRAPLRRRPERTGEAPRPRTAAGAACILGRNMDLTTPLGYAGGL